MKYYKEAINMNRQQARRLKMLERMGKNLQSRMSTVYMDFNRLIPDVGFINISTFAQ
jgi:hypothetical protein